MDTEATPPTVPFNRPYATGREAAYLADVAATGRLSGDGPYTARCTGWLEARTGSPRAFLTHSCTAALEMAALLAGLAPGDEVIMPSFTFVSTANAVVLRGAVPVFVDIRADTLNLDETLVEAAVTPRTRAIFVVHYAGVACEMDAIMAVAARHDLLVVEDAAQGALASYRGRALGSIGHLGCLSFHETKNLVCGEGGALLVGDARFAKRAEIIREKGTNRSQFFRGEVDKYTWVDAGSSYLPSELNAAFLWAQFEAADAITARRIAIWEAYHAAFAAAEAAGQVRRPVVPEGCTHNGHLYYLLLPDLAARSAFIARLKAAGIQASFHYVPLHASPFGRAAGRAAGDLPVTRDCSDRLVRLPLWCGVEAFQPRVIETALDALGRG